MEKRVIAILGIVVLAVLSRLLPHPWNWTAVGAASLFAGAKFQRLPVALAVPLLSLALSDLILGFHGTWFFVYGAFALIVLLGWWLRDRLEGRSIAVASVGSSLLFYFLTNFGVWWMGTFYSPDFAGLMMSYAAGLPFLANQIVGDLVYAGLLFGLWSLVEMKFSSMALTSKS